MSVHSRESLKERLYAYLQKCYKIDQSMWIHKDELVELSQGAGYNAENAARRLRELSGVDDKVDKMPCPWAKGTIYRYRP